MGVKWSTRFLTNPITRARKTDYLAAGRAPTGPVGQYGDLFALTNAIYIANNGSDSTVTNNGSLTCPYLTLNGALTAITDNSSSKIYTIIDLRGGPVTEAAIALKPFIYYNGNGIELTITALTIHSSWNGANSFATYENFILGANSGVNIDLSSFSSHSYILGLNDIQVLTTATALTFKGVNANTVFNFNNFNTSQIVGGAVADINISNCAWDFVNCKLGNVTSSNTSIQNVGTFRNCECGDHYNISSPTNASVEVQFIACVTDNASGILQASGSSTLIILDACSYFSNSTLSGGAQIFLTSLAEAIFPNYVPTNYTPFSPTTGFPISLLEHLKGINLALSGFAGDSILLNSKIIFVGINGNDTSGDGSFDLPYATVGKAMTQATGNTSVHTLIMVGPGTYTESDIHVKPNTDIFAYGSNTQLTVTGIMDLDSTTWGAAGSTTRNTYQGFSISGIVTFDFSSTNSSWFPSVYFRNIFSLATITITGEASGIVTVESYNSIFSVNVYNSVSYAHHFSCHFAGATIFNNSTQTQAIDGRFFSCYFEGSSADVTVNGVDGFGSNVFFVGCTNNGNTLTSNGANANISLDSASYTTDIVSTSSGSFSYPYLNRVQSFTKAQGVTPVTVTSSSNSVATDASLSNNFKLTMTQNTTLANPTNMVNGFFYQWRIIQDSTARTLAFGSKFKFPGGSAGVISTGSGAVDILSGYYDSTSDTLDCVYMNAFS